MTLNTHTICLLFIFLAGNLGLAAQRYDCKSKQSQLLISPTSCQTYQYRSNLIPIRLDWYQNRKRIKSVQARYNKRYTRFIKDTLVTEWASKLPNYYNRDDSAWVHYTYTWNRSSIQHTNHPFYINLKDSVFSADPTIGVNDEGLDDISPPLLRNLCFQHIDDYIRPIGKTIFDTGQPVNYLLDTNIRAPRQIIASANNLLYILDQNYTNNAVNAIWRVSDSFKYQPKIVIYDYIQMRYLGQIPRIYSQYPIRKTSLFACNKDSCRFAQALRYNNFDLFGRRLYLNFSFRMRDSLAVYDLDSNKWIHLMALPGDTFIYHDSLYSPKNGFYDADYAPIAGKSNIRVDKDGNILVAEYKGNIYKIASDYSRIDTLFHYKDSLRLGFFSAHYTTKKFEVDGWGNLYLPDFQSKNIKRWNRITKSFDILIDTIHLGCVSNLPVAPPVVLYTPFSLQTDCNGNIYAEYDRVKDTWGEYCSSKYFLKFDAYIEDTFSFKLGVQDTLSVVAYFYDGDSTKAFLTNPYEIKYIDSQVCNQFRFKNNLYTSSSTIQDTVLGMNCIDTLAIYKFKVYKDTLIKLNHQSCTDFLYDSTILNSSGTYIFKYVSANQCDSIVSLDLRIGLNTNLKLENGIHYTSLQDSVLYQWYRCNPWRRIANETRQTFTTKTKGSYAVVLDNGKGCRDTSACVELYSSQLQLSPADGTRWSVYPNPFRDELIVDVGKEYRELGVKIYDLTGRLMHSQAFKNNSTFKINNSKLPSGIYYLQIETESHNQFFNIRRE